MKKKFSLPCLRNLRDINIFKIISVYFIDHVIHQTPPKFCVCNLTWEISEIPREIFSPRLFFLMFGNEKMLFVTFKAEQTQTGRCVKNEALHERGDEDGFYKLKILSSFGLINVHKPTSKKETYFFLKKVCFIFTC